ncbi:MAG: beta galactosidase jelly roll domain-containing protein [Bacteroidales bacterium]|nr:beta galactosidase jelly roll domain-containing protein [Candidatus Cryptobacteroides choladohippi]
MRKKALLSAIAALFVISLSSTAQELSFETAKFHFGDNPEWKNADFDDSSWQDMQTVMRWDDQGFPGYLAEYGWYRIHFNISELLKTSDYKSALKIYCGRIDDADEVYINGRKIGKTGGMPDSETGFATAWKEDRWYVADLKEGFVNLNGDNVLAIRVWNEDGDGGMYHGPVTMQIPSKCDAMEYSLKEAVENGQSCIKVSITNPIKEKQKGCFKLMVHNPETGEIFDRLETTLTIGWKQKKVFTFPLPERGYCRVDMNYTDVNSGTSRSYSITPKYILTPDEPLAPRFNGAMLFGVRPDSPVIYRIPVSGKRPMTITSADLPDGLTIDSENCCIGGKLSRSGEYRFHLHAQNAEGAADTELTIRVGDQIALTPPMGWNSWNCWGLSVSQEKVISSAQAIIDKGLADYGYNYINVDDAWEAPERNADGTIAVNGKFPSMKGLGDRLHSHGLRFGIYSSPGDRTCGGYLGSLDHELQDAQSYNEWGVDYLKYDWCGYVRKHATEVDRGTVASYVRPYMLMGEYLRNQPRDIFYSLCQYGMADVWKWGYAVDANSWRTTGDITDTWESLEDIGFKEQRELYPYGQPNHWNDPDMMIVGKVGWSDNLRDSRLTADEQYTHISLWALLAANMLIGCDVAQMDDFTRQLLCNHEVNAINQDILGRQARPVVVDGRIEIWARELADGTMAFGIFNRGEKDATVDISRYADFYPGDNVTLRNLWIQEDVPAGTTSFFVPSHGVKLLKTK